MSIARSFGPVAEEMSAALEQYSKEELIDLLTHIVKTYVVEGTLPLKPDVGVSTSDEQLAQLSFPQLILHLQMRLDHREWNQFSVSGEDVWVSVGGQRLNLTGRPSALPQVQAPGRAPAAARPEAAAQPAAPAAAAAPPAPNPTPRQETPPQVPPQPTVERASDEVGPAGPAPEDLDAPGEPFQDDAEPSDRFGMLEFD
jgi:hypothetical protein